MSKPFDATTKELLERDPQAWIELLLGRKVEAAVRVLNVELATITPEVDALILVESPTPWIVHIEFQAGDDPTLPLRIQRYNILVHYREGLPVQSVALLLRPEADGPAMSGLLQHRLPDGLLYHEFRYNVVRIRERPVEEILAGGLATLPLAPIARIAADDLPGLIRRMERRIEDEATQNEAGELWVAAYLLAGLIYPKEFTGPLFQGIRAMKESSSYQAILEEGRVEGRVEGLVEGRVEGLVEGEIKLLKRLGTRRFGSPDPSILARIESITDLERIEFLSERLLEVASWEELLAD
jgi:predicted transposase YdaD